MAFILIEFNMLTDAIKILVGLLLIGLGIIFIKFGDKQFSKYDPVSRVVFGEWFSSEKMRILGRRFMKWFLGLFFIIFGIVVIFAITFQ